MGAKFSSTLIDNFSKEIKLFSSSAVFKCTRGHVRAHALVHAHSNPRGKARRRYACQRQCGEAKNWGTHEEARNIRAGIGDSSGEKRLLAGKRTFTLHTSHFPVMRKGKRKGQNLLPRLTHYRMNIPTVYIGEMVRTIFAKIAFCDF